MTKTASLENLRCDMCDSSSYRVVFCKSDGTRILECVGCSLVYVWPQTLREGALADYYQNDRSLDARREQKIRRLRSPLSRLVLEVCYGYPAVRPRNPFEKFIARAFRLFVATNIVPYAGEGKILDIGCGNGAYLSILKEIGWKTFGVEVNKRDCEIARGLGVNAFCGDLESAHFPSRSFDVVRMCQVLEHLSSPRQAFQEIKRVMKPGAAFYLEVPNQKSFAFRCFKHRYLSAGGHLFGFSRATLGLLCAKSGMTVARVRYKSSKGITLQALSYAAPFLGFLFSIGIFRSLIRIFIVTWLRPVLDALTLGDTMVAEIKSEART